MSKLFNQDYLKYLSAQYGLRPSRGYGQNFLIDEEVIEKIIAAAALTDKDVVVEVGPGFGVLTLAMAPFVKKVVSFEIEKKLVAYWEKTLPDKQIKNVQIVWGNALRMFESVIASTEGMKQPPYQTAISQNSGIATPLDSATLRSGLAMTNYKVVANLPYQITSAVIRMLLEAAHPPTGMVVMVQKEVGERLCAKPGEMSVLAITAQYYADIEYLFTVPNTAFWPSPKVDSAVIECVLRPRTAAMLAEADDLFALVKLGFSSPRKKLTSNLKSVLNAATKGKVEDALIELGHPMDARAQALSVADWQTLRTALRG